LESGEFFVGLLALGGVLGVVLFGEVAEKVGAFEDDAASGVFLGEFAEVFEELGLDEGLPDAAFVVNGFFGKLNDGAGFDVAVGADVVTDAGGGGAECLAVVSVVGVDDSDGFADSGVDDEFADAALFFGGEGEVFAGVGADGPIDVEPHVEDAHFDESVGPFIADHVVDVGFANAGADAGEEFGIEAVL